MKTVKLLFVLGSVFTTIQAFCQEQNEFRIYYGKSTSYLLQNEELAGSPSYENTNFNEFGVRYLRQLYKGLYLEPGVSYLSTNVEISTAPLGTPAQSRSERLALVSVPVYVNYTFLKYLFVNAGPIVDFQLTDNTIDSQSGLGYGIGLGAKYYIDKFSLFVTPNFKRHAVIPFNKEMYHQKLTEIGIQVGLGYTF